MIKKQKQIGKYTFWSIVVGTSYCLIFLAIIVYAFVVVGTAQVTAHANCVVANWSTLPNNETVFDVHTIPQYTNCDVTMSGPLLLLSMQ